MLTESEYLKIKEMTNRIIALIKWKGASFESKQNKIIKELSFIKDYSYHCLNKNNSSNQSHN